MTRPRVSVIVPVRNRRVLLRQALDALAAQTLSDHEVVVVDDGSSDGSAEEAERDAAAGRPVRVVRAAGGSSGAARDRGVAVAIADYLAFTDSDCFPAPDWLERGVAALDQGADLVQGFTRPARSVGPLERSIWVTREDGLYATCNIFVRRCAYERAGGFENSARPLSFRAGSGGLAIAFGADSLLGWRVKRNGPVMFRPEAVVEHHVFDPDLRDAFSRAWMSRGFPALVRAAPELRATLLHRRLFLGSARRLWLYAGVLSFVGRRRVAAATLLTLWLSGHLRRVAPRTPGWRGRARAVPIEVALDAVTGGALLVGSAQAKTVVL
ncbi:MAG TPA: glycosyltransferase family A protein [Acidimicrobiales bacterium]|nr:glycosyltransferase family A protein [Acidimicrobiales bacterium]